MVGSGLHHRFLTLCLAGSADAEDCLKHPKWDWELAIQIAAEELVLPSLRTATERVGLQSSLPAKISDVLAAVHQLNTDRNQLIWEEILVVTEALNGVGIEPVLLKGAAYLAEEIYANAGDRYLADIDLLLPSEQVQTAVVLLQGRGFLLDTKDRLGIARHHHPPLIRPGKIGLELHHKLGIGSIDRVLSAETLLRESLPRTFSGRRIRIPSPEHLAVHLIAHSQLHHPYIERLWPPLRAIYDLQLVRAHYGSGLDWQKVSHAFEHSGTGGIYRMHVRQVGQLMRCPFPGAAPKPTDGIRWFRRTLLWRYDWLRFLDPLYLLHVLLRSRLQVLLLAIRTPGQWSYIATTPLRANFYRRLWTDLFNR